MLSFWGCAAAICVAEDAKALIQSDRFGTTAYSYIAKKGDKDVKFIDFGCQHGT